MKKKKIRKSEALISSRVSPLMISNHCLSCCSSFPPFFPPSYPLVSHCNEAAHLLDGAWPVSWPVMMLTMLRGYTDTQVHGGVMQLLMAPGSYIAGTVVMQCS